MTDEQMHEASMVLHALSQALDDLRECAEKPEFARYFMENAEELYGTAHLLGATLRLIEVTAQQEAA